jgi:hypothetical protein
VIVALSRTRSGGNILILGLEAENIAGLLNDQPILHDLGDVLELPLLHGWEICVLGPEDTARLAARQAINGVRQGFVEGTLTPDVVAQRLGQVAQQHGIIWACENGHALPFGVSSCPTCGTTRMVMERARGTDAGSERPDGEGPAAG